MLIIKAGRARSEGDFVVGAGPTVAMTLKSQSRAVLSVGRVQTATLNMVVQRELEIRNFKPKDYYVLKGCFNRKTMLYLISERMHLKSLNRKKRLKKY